MLRGTLSPVFHTPTFHHLTFLESIGGTLGLIILVAAAIGMIIFIVAVFRSFNHQDGIQIAIAALIPTVVACLFIVTITDDAQTANYGRYQTNYLRNEATYDRQIKDWLYKSYQIKVTPKQATELAEDSATIKVLYEGKLTDVHLEYLKDQEHVVPATVTVLNLA